MKTLSIKLADVNQDSIGNLLKWISECYHIEFTDNDPDFIIHSCFDHQVLKYDGVRIAWLGENLQPDFNISDYGMGFGRIAFADRYRRIPLYRWYFSDYESLFDNFRNLIKIDGHAELLNKTRFCTMVVSNSSRGSYFAELQDKITRYKTIDSGGKWQNNIGGPIEQKMPFIKEGKFHLAFENSSAPGYVTEKILHAFAARTIPVYWGAPDVVEDFNSKAFINCHEYESLADVVKKIKELDRDDAAYISMLEEPCFLGGKEPEWLKKINIMSWITSIFDQSKSEAYRRNIHFWGDRYQQELKTAFFRPDIQAAKLAKRFIRRAILKHEL